eukprot:2264167-Prymnesium_polylepis.1
MRTQIAWRQRRSQRVHQAAISKRHKERHQRTARAGCSSDVRSAVVRKVVRERQVVRSICPAGGTKCEFKRGGRTRSRRHLKAITSERAVEGRLVQGYGQCCCRGWTAICSVSCVQPEAKHPTTATEREGREDECGASPPN